MEKRILLVVAILFLTGMVSYHFLEGWSWLDSLYFSVSTLTTIGYGDLHPTSDASKIFTIVYVLGGISIVLYVISNMQQSFLHLENRIERIIRKTENNKERKK